MKEGTSRQFGCHPTKDAAQKQQAALYANESKASTVEVPMSDNTEPAQRAECPTCHGKMVPQENRPYLGIEIPEAA